MIHYHGTPITPNIALESMAGENFCISFAHPQNLKRCLKIGQSLMLDNGAFSAFTKGAKFDPLAFYKWIEPILGHPHWAVVPDIIDGTLEQQREMVKTWPYPKALGVPVWHLGMPIDYLLELSDDWGKVCLGSSGEYWQVGSAKWEARMDLAFNALAKRRFLPWTHGLRMLGMGDGRWPLSSADSTNVAVNHNKKSHCAGCMAKLINAQNPSNQWRVRPEQQALFI